MSDVTTKLMRGHLDFLAQRGHDLNAFWNRLEAENPDDPYLKRDQLLRHRRVPWASFISFFELQDRLLGPGTWESDFFDESMKPRVSWIPYVHTIMGMVTSPQQTYRFVNALVGPSLFGHIVTSTFEVLGDGRFHIRLSLKTGYRPSLRYFQVCQEGMRRTPGFLGLPNSIVEAETSDTGGDYFITPPVSHSLGARIVRSFRAFFFAEKFLKEISHQETELRHNYTRLQASEAELLRAREALEERVQERTRELQTTNNELRERLEELLRKEEENRQLYERLLHLQKLETIGTLASGISHEINNVLYGVFLSIDLAERKLEDGDPAREDVEMAKKFASRGRDLMKQVLAFSRKMQTHREAVDLKHVVHETVKMMRSTLPKSIDIQESVTDFAGRAVCVWADFTLLQQILVNLCSNAAHAMQSTQGSEAHGRKPVLTIQLDAHESGSEGEAVITVADTGHGIPEAIRHRIFEPFFTTKPVGEGTGMGLAVVNGIVESHGGRMTVESQEGCGAVFRVALPLYREEAFAEPEEMPLGGNERLLVVEDDSELLNLMKDTLEAFGYGVLATKDPLEAVRLLSSHPHSIDLMVTDFSMPGMTGLELAHQARSIRPDLPVVLCTAFSEIKSIELARGQIIRSVVPKPFDGIRLNESIREALDPRSSSPK